MPAECVCTCVYVCVHATVEFVFFSFFGHANLESQLNHKLKRMDTTAKMFSCLSPP